MKLTAYSIFTSLLLVASAHAGSIACYTADGINFTIEQSMKSANCQVNVIHMGDTEMVSAASNGCSSLSAFVATDGAKLSLTANGLGSMARRNGGIKNVNCNL